jgi:DNA-binding NarL/FixJ family response regulator
MTVRLLLVGDRPLMRRRLRDLLEDHEGCEVVAEATNGAEGARLAQIHQPTVAVIDLMPTALSSVDATRRILAQSPFTRVIVLSVHSDEAYIAQARDAGAAGFVLTDSADVDLPTAVREVSEGRPFLSPALRHTREDDAQTPLG